MKTEEAILKIAEILDVLAGNFIPDCGGDFKQGTSYCKGCSFYHQCRKGTEVQDLCEELQRLLVDKGSRGISKENMVYYNGFNDANNGLAKCNPHEQGTELYGLYEAGYFDGAV